VKPARPRVPALAATGLIIASLALAFVLRSAAAAEVSVEAGNNYFCSSTFESGLCETAVTAGDTVTWTLSGGVHTVTLCDESFTQCPPAGGWDSGVLEAGDSYSQTFTAPGSYPYYCALHPSDMRGRIAVTAPTPSPTAAPSATPTPVLVIDGPLNPTPAALPVLGGRPGSGDSAAIYTTIGAILVAGAVISFAFARKRSH
jgi:plastocyanin